MNLDITLTCKSLAADLLSTGKLQVELVSANVSRLVETLSDYDLATLAAIVLQEQDDREESQ